MERKEEEGKEEICVDVKTNVANRDAGDRPDDEQNEWTTAAIYVPRLFMEWCNENNGSDRRNIYIVPCSLAFSWHARWNTRDKSLPLWTDKWHACVRVCVSSLRLESFPFHLYAFSYGGGSTASMPLVSQMSTVKTASVFVNGRCVPCACVTLLRHLNVPTPLSLNDDATPRAFHQSRVCLQFLSLSLSLSPPHRFVLFQRNYASQLAHNDTSH